MARTALAIQQVTRSGLNPTYSAANVDGHSVQNSGGEFLYVKNGSGAPINVTFQTPGTVDGQAVADRVQAVPAGQDRVFGPFQPTVYNQPDGTMSVDFSAVTSVTVLAGRV